MTNTWKVTLPCTREEADSLSEDNLFISSTDSVPTVVTREADPESPDDWVIEIYCDANPDAAFLKEIAELSPSAKLSKTIPAVEELGNEDWVTMSQQGLEPLRAGRFYVHTSNSPPLDDKSVRNICIDAGQAFGTGHHETTMCCLESLDRLKRLGQQYDNIIDVGTGTGLLAFAARDLWPTAQIIASDIDPVAIEVSAQNAAVNNVAIGHSRRAIRLETSNGLDHPAIGQRAPYDLIIANILAGPLIALAPQIAAAAASNTVLVLAGLLKAQRLDVLHAYIRVGFRLRHSRVENEWPCLTLVKAREYGLAKTHRIIRSPLASDYFGEC
ncbi:50S ribosomal protein L11 methyltransferase [Parasphingorhabdus cellanae]|uniref:Ribosomal protein L11 methyltransferase n=1 Tax=Parasphingorhabdus cellanae TaxID=2806553 RepID=A0ABX7T8X5_9SPHN|nr:50S ribosomal protein L11 methyltransferase [Parasphingorhabdus cellanae]QTD56652.1 50S ribosomal protein L11 methyltransferase [Parasphingorhabdus cellanae]